MKLGSFITGAVVGAIAAGAAVALTTPKKGEELREDIKKESEKLLDQADELTKEARNKSEEIRKEALAKSEEIRKEAKAKTEEIRKEAMAKTEEIRKEAKVKTDEYRERGTELYEKNKAKYSKKTKQEDLNSAIETGEAKVEKSKESLAETLASETPDMATL